MRLSTGRGPRRALSLVFVAAVVATVAACWRRSRDGLRRRRRPPRRHRGRARARWHDLAAHGLVSPDGAVFTVPAAVTPLLAFDGGNLTGNAGCNTFNSTYTITGDAIEIGPIMSTKMACEEPMSTVEGAYLAALDAVEQGRDPRRRQAPAVGRRRQDDARLHQGQLNRLILVPTGSTGYPDAL